VPFRLWTPVGRRCTSSIARWRQCTLGGGHVAGTCRITLNHPSTAAMRLMANYFDHWLDTPTYTVAQTAKRLEASTVLWAFHTIQPSSFLPQLAFIHAGSPSCHPTKSVKALNDKQGTVAVAHPVFIHRRTPDGRALIPLLWLSVASTNTPSL